MQLFDTCIITTSDERQADLFRRLIGRRIEHGLYPREIDFRVVADPPGGRIGNGGGTMWALLRLLDDLGAADPRAFFDDHRVLVIHAGGESRRMPCFAPEGKLFAPLPVASSSIFPPVVLDLELALFLKYPWRHGEVIMTSGDVIIDFDTEFVPEDRGDICGFAKAAPPEQGAHHGVFVFDARGEHVLDFHQKASPAFLAANARIRDTAECALDIGIVSMSPAFASALTSLADEPLADGQRVGDAVRGGRAHFDMYLELMTACLPSLGLDEYRRRIGGRSRCADDLVGRIYGTLHRFPLRGVLARKTTFLHVGGLREFPRVCLDLQAADLAPFYAASPDVDGEEIRPQRSGDVMVANSAGVRLPSANRAPVVADGVVDASLERAEGDNVFIGLKGWRSAEPVPRGICLDERTVDGAVYRLTYGIDDTFAPNERIEDAIFCGTPLVEWLAARRLVPADLWDVPTKADLLAAHLFCPEMPEEFTVGYWKAPSDASAWAASFRNSKQLSLEEINRRTDVIAREDARIALRKAHLRGLIESGLGWRLVSAMDVRETFGIDEAPSLEALLARTDDSSLLRSYRRAHVRARLGTSDARDVEAISFGPSRRDGRSLAVGVKEDQIVWARSPLRLDLAGGWSDTPPYTMRFGGRVVNVAVDLNGQPPVQVFCRRTAERRIRFHSIDLGVTETITATRGLLDYRDPHSPFALPKAALCLLGLAEEGEDRPLEGRLDDIGCGIEITLLCAVPKGSGLGTSSILGGVILSALMRFFSRQVTSDDLFLQVLELEQMLTTGGGWQDQIGGIAGGVKYIESRPGLRPKPVIHQLDPFLFEDERTHGCFTLFYTGITRLARNILQEVVRQVDEATPAYLFTHRHIKELAREAREAISLRSIPALARVIRGSWEANKLIHPSATNDEVEGLIARAAPYSLGMKLLGAGGGGYALFVSPDPDAAARLRDLLDEHARESRARTVDFAIDKQGLVVSVS